MIQTHSKYSGKNKLVHSGLEGEIILDICLQYNMCKREEKSVEWSYGAIKPSLMSLSIIRLQSRMLLFPFLEANSEKRNSDDVILISR